VVYVDDNYHRTKRGRRAQRYKDPAQIMKLQNSQSDKEVCAEATEKALTMHFNLVHANIHRSSSVSY
jgi:hypothetical protein